MEASRVRTSVGMVAPSSRYRYSVARPIPRLVAHAVFHRRPWPKISAKRVRHRSLNVLDASPGMCFNCLILSQVSHCQQETAWLHAQERLWLPAGWRVVRRSRASRERVRLWLRFELHLIARAWRLSAIADESRAPQRGHGQRCEGLVTALLRMTVPNPRFDDDLTFSVTPRRPRKI